MSADAPAVMGVKEIADFLGIRKPNVRKLLARYDVEPVAVLALGPVFSRTSIEELKRLRDADEEARASDEKRRATARAKRDA